MAGTLKDKIAIVIEQAAASAKPSLLPTPVKEQPLLPDISLAGRRYRRR